MFSRQVKDPVTGWWHNVPEPKAVTLATAFAYSLIAAAGASALIDPPNSVKEGLDKLWVIYWVWLLLGGGVIGAISSLKGWYWAERIAVVSVVTGLAMYTSIIMEQHLIPGQNKLPTFFLMTTLTGAAAARWIRVSMGMKETKPGLHRKKHQG